MIYKYRDTPEYTEERREIFHFMIGAWDVGKAIALVEGREPNSTIDPTRMADSCLGPEYTPGVDYDCIKIPLIGINETHALSARVDTSKPVIMVELRKADGELLTYLVIDGWHRVWRGRHDGLPELPVHLLTADEEKSVRLRGDWDRPEPKEKGRAPRRPRLTRGKLEAANA